MTTKNSARVVAVPWSMFRTYPDGRPKFDDPWLMNPSNVVSRFSSDPGQYCRLCDSYFAGAADEHVADHAPGLAAERETQKRKTVAAVLAERRQRVTVAIARARTLGDEGKLPAEIAEIMGVSKRTVLRYLDEVGDISANSDFPRNHAGKSGQDAETRGKPDAPPSCARARASCPPALTEEHRRKAHTPPAHRRRKQTFGAKTEGRRAEAWALLEQGLVPRAIADQLGISDRTVRRYLDQPTRS